MSSKRAEAAVGIRGTYEETHGPVTTHVVIGAQPSSSKNSQQEHRYNPWLAGYLQWLEGKEAREEHYGRLERMSGR